MKRKQVIYKYGDNNKFDYFILSEKSEISLDKNSLAYKIDPSSDKSFVIEFNTSIGNFDILIEQHTKDGDFKGYIFCDRLDVELT